MGGTAKKIKTIKPKFLGMDWGSPLKKDSTQINWINSIDMLHDPMNSIDFKWDDGSEGTLNDMRENLVSQVTPDAPPATVPTDSGEFFNKIDKSPRSALALEQRLRSNKRKSINPNVEFTSNLEANPNKKGGK